ncbi:protein PIMREG-like [Hoplias malabaricus]|uniref:protein PIMREG-like n=1 Tax=Hoplias malabaricus TaxID=27720 RepID=UPI003461C26A
MAAMVSGMWRTHTVLPDSDPEGSPEAPQQTLRKLRSSSSLNSLRMSLRKRLPLKTVQPNNNIPDNPTWESLEINKKTSAMTQMKRSTKNSIGNAYQKVQRRLGSREECLVRTPGKIAEGEENDCTTACTPKRPSRSAITPRRTPRSTSKNTPRAIRTPEASGSAVRAVRTGGTRRQLVRMAALRSPFASPNRRQFDQDLDCVSKGLRRLKSISQAFEDVIKRDDRKQAVEHYSSVMAQGCRSIHSSVSGNLHRASIRQQTRRICHRVSSWTDGALSNIHKAT